MPRSGILRTEICATRLDSSKENFEAVSFRRDKPILRFASLRCVKQHAEHSYKRGRFATDVIFVFGRHQRSIQWTLRLVDDPEGETTDENNFPMISKSRRIWFDVKQERKPLVRCREKRESSLAWRNLGIKLSHDLWHYKARWSSVYYANLLMFQHKAAISEKNKRNNLIIQSTHSSSHERRSSLSNA